ncbi:MAG: hypothetical protein NT069_08290 [Planctomycetota bacterium]|nr:hypothetical protein [Planctomycetota bacterium]
MNIADRTIWQIAGGDTDRSYVSTFLRWDVVAIGPGQFGRWPECKSEARRGNRYSARVMTCLERFYGMQAGDLVVLRLGTSSIYGVGEVVGSATLWLDDFGDIDGWDLEHVRRVKWLWKNEPQPQTFDSMTLKWGDTVQKLTSPKVFEWLSQLDLPAASATRGLRELPKSCVNGQPGSLAKIEKVADLLFDEGIPAKSIDDLLEQIDDHVRIARWYARTKQAPSESETVAYLVVPLLRTLGWTPQRMSVEWNHVDVALFNRTPRKDQHLRAVVEVKKMNNSCLTAWSQAKDYALCPGREKCRQLIVTDGLRYAVFLREENGNDFRQQPIAYFNLTRTRDDYPILECQGAGSALLTMAADWNGDTAFLRGPENPAGSPFVEQDGEEGLAK